METFIAEIVEAVSNIRWKGEVKEMIVRILERLVDGSGGRG